MGNDLFVMMSNNKYNTVVEQVENRVAEMVACRHEYPLWPIHDGALDDFEQDYHGNIRHSYYVSAVYMIQILRALRNIS